MKRIAYSILGLKDESSSLSVFAVWSKAFLQTKVHWSTTPFHSRLTRTKAGEGGGGDLPKGIFVFMWQRITEDLKEYLYFMKPFFINQGKVLSARIVYKSVQPCACTHWMTEKLLPSLDAGASGSFCFCDPRGEGSRSCCSSQGKESHILFCCLCLSCVCLHHLLMQFCPVF